MIGTTEIVVIVAAGLILFGATALPKFARSLGQAKKEFQKGIREAADEEQEDEDTQEKSKSRKQPKRSVSAGTKKKTGSKKSKEGGRNA